MTTPAAGAAAGPGAQQQHAYEEAAPVNHRNPSLREVEIIARLAPDMSVCDTLRDQ